MGINAALPIARQSYRTCFPSQVAVTMFLLYRQVGLSCLVGVAIAVVMIPLNKYVADKIGAMSTKMMSAKDERVKLMSEVLHGVRSIKFFAWEEYFLGRVGRDCIQIFYDRKLMYFRN